MINTLGLVVSTEGGTGVVMSSLTPPLLEIRIKNSHDSSFRPLLFLCLIVGVVGGARTKTRPAIRTEVNDDYLDT